MHQISSYVDYSYYPKKNNYLFENPDHVNLLYHFCNKSKVVEFRVYL